MPIMGFMIVDLLDAKSLAHGGPQANHLISMSAAKLNRRYSSRQHR
jgi:hypothetical protein